MHGVMEGGRTGGRERGGKGEGYAHAQRICMECVLPRADPSFVCLFVNPVCREFLGAQTKKAAEGSS